MTAKGNDFRLSLLRKDLEPVESVKDLGVILDTNLRFHEHIVSTVSSCMSRLRQINCIKHVFDKNALIIYINFSLF